MENYFFPIVIKITMIAIFILIVLFIIIIFKSKNNNVIERYNNHLPYDFHWNIYKCLNQDCVKKNAFECYRTCENKFKKKLYDGIYLRCKKNCLDHADMQFNHLKYNNYIFNDSLLFFDPK